MDSVDSAAPMRTCCDRRPELSPASLGTKYMGFNVPCFHFTCYVHILTRLMELGLYADAIDTHTRYITHVQRLKRHGITVGSGSSSNAGIKCQCACHGLVSHHRCWWKKYSRWVYLFRVLPHITLQPCLKTLRLVKRHRQRPWLQTRAAGSTKTKRLHH